MLTPGADLPSDDTICAQTSALDAPSAQVSKAPEKVDPPAEAPKAEAPHAMSNTQVKAVLEEVLTAPEPVPATKAVTVAAAAARAPAAAARRSRRSRAGRARSR